MYEQGGGGSNSGNAQVICGPQGEPLAPAWAPLRLYAQDRHAGFEGEGLIVIRAVWWHGEVVAEARREGEGEVIYSLDHMGRESVPDSPLRAAAQAAIEKAQCWHCRCHHFVAKEQVIG